MDKLKNKPTRLMASVEIDATQSEIWDVVKEFGNIAVFHPMVKHSESMNDIVGVGAQRHCALSPMGEMKEEITSWEEGKSYTADVVGGKMLPPYQYMNGKLELETVDDKTKVTFTFTYELIYGWFGRLLNIIMVRPMFKKAPMKYVTGLKDYIESRESNLR